MILERVQEQFDGPFEEKIKRSSTVIWSNGLKYAFTPFFQHLEELDHHLTTLSEVAKTKEEKALLAECKNILSLQQEEDMVFCVDVIMDSASKWTKSLVRILLEVLEVLDNE